MDNRLTQKLFYLIKLMIDKREPHWALVFISVPIFLLACKLALPPINKPSAISASIDQPTVTAVITVTPTPTATLAPTPTPIPALRILSGDRAFENGDWELASTEYQQAYHNSQDTEILSSALLGIGRAQYASHHPEQAITSLEKFLPDFSSSPNLPDAYFNLARAYNATGRYGDASEAYLNYLALRPGLIDGYVLNLRGDALQAAGNFAEAANDYRAALQSPSFLNHTELQIKIARTHALAGDYQTAIALYDELYNSSDSDNVKAQMDFYKGQAFTALGQMEDAYSSYLDAVDNYPTSYDTYQGLIILVDAGIPVNELNRGIVDYYAGQYGVALAALDRYLQSNPVEAATAQYYYGLTQRALGNYTEAIDAWTKIIQNYPEDRNWDDAWEQKAYTQWWYQEDYSSAIKTLLDFVSTAPDHPRAAEFLFDAASVAERDGQLEEAAKHWEKVARDYPGYENATRALFLAGISYYRKGDYSQANNLFRSVLANASTMQERAASYLWQGKTQKAFGDEEGALVTWDLAAAADPTGYYSERARDILRNLEPFTPPQIYDLSMDLAAEKKQAEDWLKSTFALPEDTNPSTAGTLMSDARYQRGDELWRLGLYEEARAEFEDLRLAIQNDPISNYQLASHLSELGLYRTAIFSARQVLDLAGMDDASSQNAPLYFNHIRFGPYYEDLIIPIAQRYLFHPLFLMSLIRQESAFEGFVHSSAGARGLMQIIPATGQEIVNSLDWPSNYTDEDLYRPLVSITLGSDYLAGWRDRLGDDLFIALAAYNAGPGNATEWQKLANNDPDLFLEVIRFEETRNYIRGVYEIFNIYRRLYNRTP